MMQYRNAKFVDASRVDCEINHPKFGWIPYTLDPADQDMGVDNTKLLDQMAKNKDVAVFTPPEKPPHITEENKRLVLAAEVRAERNRRLVVEVDLLVGTPLQWEEAAQERKDALAKHRTLLLDVPQQPGFPSAVVWPRIV